MSAIDLIRLIVRSAFVLIAAVTLLDYLRYRDRARLDSALMFGSLGLVILGSGLQQALPFEAPWFSSLVALMLLIQPYLLLRLVGHFRPVSPRLQVLAIGGLVACGLVLLIPPALRPPPVLLVLIFYFVALEGYATWCFIDISRRAGGVTQWRTLFAALGSGWLTIAILMIGVPLLLPAARQLATPLYLLSSLLSVVSYYLGFAPPAPLRRAWQLSVLHRFLRQAAGLPIADRLEDTLAHLCPALSHTAGAALSAVFLWDPPSQQLILKASDRPGWQPAPLAVSEGALARAWGEQRFVVANQPAQMGQPLAGLAAALGVGSLAVAPIASAERKRGVLLVFRVQPSLFPIDDEDMLRLFADQAAEVLESGELFTQQQALVEHLEMANKDLESFTYSVSHDLRAPLRAMNGFSQVLLEDYAAQMSEQAQHYVRRIHSNSQQMGLLVDDLLALSRFGRQTLNLQPVDPAVIARQVWEDLRHEHAGRVVHLEIAELPVCLADPSLLRQVYANLLGNALKFTRDQPEARIIAGCRDGQSGATYFVRDNGVGFDMAYASKLFGVFQRLHRSEEFEGTGVGLAIVHRIVERHGGSVAAESVVGHGATFSFTLKGV